MPSSPAAGSCRRRSRPRRPACAARRGRRLARRRRVAISVTGAVADLAPVDAPWRARTGSGPCRRRAGTSASPGPSRTRTEKFWPIWLAALPAARTAGRDGARLGPGAGVDAVAAAATAGVGAALAAERAERAQERDQPLLVGRGQPGVQCALVGGLGEQLGDVAVDVGLARAVADRLAAERRRRPRCSSRRRRSRW